MNSNWQLLTFPELEDITQAKELCHQAIQNVSAVGRNFLPKEQEDSQSNLEWDAKLQRLAGRWIETESITFRSSFSLIEFKVYLVDKDLNTLSSISMQDKVQNDVMIWLEKELKEIGLESSHIDLAYPYKIPEYPTAKGKPFHIINFVALRELSRLYHNTAFILKELRKSEATMTHTRCWPHHFDIAARIVRLDTGDPTTSKSISLGMSPGDHYYKEPYFYATPWPYITEGLSDISHTLAHWHDEDWIGAVLPVSKLKNLVLIQDQRNQVIHFFKEALRILKEHAV